MGYLAVFVLVPKAAMDEYGCFPISEYDIRFSWQIRGMESVSVAFSIE